MDFNSTTVIRNIAGQHADFRKQIILLLPNKYVLNILLSFCSIVINLKTSGYQF